ncbi:MAG TPA: hypothetical protein VKB53_07850 [Gammaproteobacteria bacterium]|nr:hypothetical protein [Gammaproteobacteria bacterium]
MTVPSGKVYEETRGLGILERELMRHPGWSKLAFIEHRLTDNPGNWRAAANHADVEALLRSSGLWAIGRPGVETYLCEPDCDNPLCIMPWDHGEFEAITGQRLAMATRYPS